MQRALRSLWKISPSPRNSWSRGISGSAWLRQQEEATAAAEDSQSQQAKGSQGNESSSPSNDSSAQSAQSAQSLVPIGYASGDQSMARSSPFGQASASARLQSFSHELDLHSMLDVFADWMTSQKWVEIKELFEQWIKSLDQSGRPNRPDVNLYNHYLRANLMLSASASDLLDFVSQMHNYALLPNTASFNLVLKAMFQSRETQASVRLLDRMIHTGQDASPDEETYEIVVGLLFQENEIESALKYLDLALKSGYMISTNVFASCVRACVAAGRLDTLTKIIEDCKAMDQNKSLCPPWNLCTYISDVAIQADISKLAFFGLDFLSRWMARGMVARPPVILSVDEGLTVSAMGTAARTCDLSLLKKAWEILMRSLPQPTPQQQEEKKRRLPSAEAYLAKIHAFAALGELKYAFRSLHELETAYGNSDAPEDLDLFSPFTSLNPLVRSCSKGGFAVLDSVYFQLESLSRADPPYKSVTALNCIILGCSYIWDLDRAFQTFESIQNTFELSPNVHSYNALMHAFGRTKQTLEASNVFNHMTSLGVKPNELSYSLLIDAYLINRDTKSSLATIHDMMDDGFTPSQSTLRKVRRRCVREFDNDGVEQVRSLCNKLKYRMIGEGRRDMLFNLNYSTSLAYAT